MIEKTSTLTLKQMRGWSRVAYLPFLCVSSKKVSSRKHECLPSWRRGKTPSFPWKCRGEFFNGSNASKDIIPSGNEVKKGEALEYYFGFLFPVPIRQKSVLLF